MIKRLVPILLALNIYQSEFEPQFIESTKQFYLRK
jgi:cullin-4